MEQVNKTGFSCLSFSKFGSLHYFIDYVYSNYSMPCNVLLSGDLKDLYKHWLILHDRYFTEKANKAEWFSVVQGQAENLQWSQRQIFWVLIPKPVSRPLSHCYAATWGAFCKDKASHVRESVWAQLLAEANYFSEQQQQIVVSVC